MTAFFKKARGILNTKLGFFTLVVLLFAVKSYWAYKTKFNLGVAGSTQEFLVAFNTLPTAILLLGIALYFRGRLSYWLMIIINLLLSTWLFANILYYREFSDFITFNLIRGSGAASNNLGTSLAGIFQPTDLLVYLDGIVLIILLVFHIIRIDTRPFKLWISALVSTIAVLLFGVNLTMSYSDRSGLLTRTFDNNYIVKYLGLEAYTVIDGVKTTQNSAIKSKANNTDIKPVLQFLKQNHISKDVQYDGVAKGKNVFIIHLESLQQFVINKTWKGQEITPNLNRIYNSSDTLAFDNFFNQVGQGKTADAEMMLENSLYGLPEGSAMVTDGSTNTFQAAPQILNQRGYTTAAFHGDVPSFWNRDNAYKSFGYQYFISKDYYPKVKDYDAGYGIKDKIFMKDSMHYVEQLPQPFYAKLITVTNHYPYIIDKNNTSIDPWTTGDDTVDPYVQTAHYLDQSIGEFYNYLEKSGLQQNSMVVLYGDHYGISDNHKPAIAQILGEKSVNDYDLAMFQKVPFMIQMPGLKGGVNNTYGGEIDVLPTIMNLLGVDTSKYVQFGQDLLSPSRKQVVAFRNGDFVSARYTKTGSKIYDTATGKQIKKPTASQEKEIEADQKYTTTTLDLSDRVINGDLLRFYKPLGFKEPRKKDITYSLKASLKKLKALQDKLPTSVIKKNDGKSTFDDYTTDAPELKDAPNAFDFPKE